MKGPKQRYRQREERGIPRLRRDGRRKGRGCASFRDWRRASLYRCSNTGQQSLAASAIQRPAHHAEQGQRREQVDQQVERMVAPWLGPAQRIVYGERYVDQRPAAGRSQRRRQQLRDWPELPDRRIFQHGRLIVEKEWYGEGIVISSEAREQQHRDRQEHRPALARL